MTQLNSQRFLDAFSQIEKAMSEMLNETRYVSFSQMISRCAKINSVISSRQSTLREYSELRNAIVHQRGPDLEVIAEPSDAVTKDIEHIVKLLNQDDTITHYASKPVRCVSSLTSLKEAYSMMRELDTSKLPVYDDGVFTGIITIREIAQWAYNGMKESVVAEVLSQHDQDTVLFMERYDDVTDVIQKFEKVLKKGKKLQAILITEHGVKTEKPVGIITVADLPKMIQNLI